MILLRTDGRELRVWLMGVRRPTPAGDMTGDEKKRRRRLDEQLLSALGPSCSRSKWWPWWIYVNEDKRHWNPLVPALHRECEAEQDGDLTRYFVDMFVDDVGFHLAEEFYWHNPSKLPSPIEWVNKS